MESFCTLAHSRHPQPAPEEAGSWKAEQITVQRTHGGVIIIFFKGCWLFERRGGGIGRGKVEAAWGASLPLTGLFRVRRASRGPLSAAQSPAAAGSANHRGTGVSGAAGPTPGFRSPLPPSRSGSFHTAGPSTLGGSCSGHYWRTHPHSGSAGARRRTPGLQQEKWGERRHK